jgi:hypothetical protein
MTRANTLGTGVAEQRAEPLAGNTRCRHADTIATQGPFHGH